MGAALPHATWGLDRRRFLLTSLVCALGAPPAAGAQPAGKPYRIGFLAFSTCQAQDSVFRQFREALATLGYIEGRNIIIECAGTADDPDQNRVRAESLVRLKVDLIVAHGTAAALAAQHATRTTPIIIFNVADPVARGLVASLTRPGGNVTGLTNLVEGQTQKSLEMFKEAAPRLSRVAVLTDPSNQAQVALRAEQEATARTLGLNLQRLHVRRPSDLDAAFDAMLRDRTEALYLLPLRVGPAGTARIMQFAIKHQLLTVGAVSQLYSQAGVLFFYSHSLAEQFHRLAAYVDRILKGAKPADLPVEQPTKFELTINLKTAKALGLTIPPSLLARADQVIE